MTFSMPHDTWKMAQHGSKMAQDATKCFKMARIWSQEGQDGRKLDTKMAHDGHKFASRWLQDGPILLFDRIFVSKCCQMAEVCPKMFSRWHPENHLRVVGAAYESPARCVLELPDPKTAPSGAHRKLHRKSRRSSSCDAACDALRKGLF